MIPFFFVIMPYSIVWSLNTLFPVLAIPQTIETWVATFILMVFF